MSTRKRDRPNDEQYELSPEKNLPLLNPRKRRKQEMTSKNFQSVDKQFDELGSSESLLGSRRNEKKRPQKEISTNELSSKKISNTEMSIESEPAKDIYEFNSSEPEELQGILKKKRTTLGRLGSNISPELAGSGQKKIAKDNSFRSQPENESQESRARLEDNFIKLEKTPQGYINPSKVPESSSSRQNKIAVVEISSSGTSKAPKQRSTKKIPENQESKLKKRFEGTFTQEKVPKPSKRKKEISPKVFSPANEAQSLNSAQNITSLGISPLENIKTESKKGYPEPVLESYKVLENPLPRSKKKVPTKRKNVGFELTDELQLGFKDLPVIPSPQKLVKNDPLKIIPDKRNTHKDTSVNLPELVDDTACEVCKRYSVRKNNPMLLCDGCDAGYHIKCLGLMKEPESEMWYCPKCQPDIANAHTIEAVALKLPSTLSNIENLDYLLRCQQRDILDRLSGRKHVKLKGLQDETQKVQQVVEQTVLAGEGNSMLIIGSRGTGKTTLVEFVITEISKSHRESFHVVRLNGFIHTDDKLALKEIWRQLGKEMNVLDDSMEKPGNYADTMVSLLALLSHPSEIFGTESSQTAISVIIILEEFDLFTLHHRQTLLYNLFDIAQSRKAPLVVLGLTTKVDIAERLEKRVKSRFSHRFVYLSLPRSIPEFWEACKEYLIYNEDHEDHEDDKVIKATKVTSERHQFKIFWREMIEDLYNKDTAFMHHLKSIFYRTKSVPVFMNSCILPITKLSERTPVLRGTDFTASRMSLSEPDSKLQLLQGLSELELALLIAAARLDIVLDIDTCNFTMAYDEYSALTSRHKIQTSSTGLAALGVSAKVWGRDIAVEAWEKLASYELLVPAGLGAGHARNPGAAGQMWRVDVDLDEIIESVDGLSGIMTKWCKEI